jgi:hypothetical protein
MVNYSQKYSKNCFSGWKNQEKIPKKFQKFQSIDKYFIKIIPIFSVH